MNTHKVHFLEKSGKNIQLDTPYIWIFDYLKIFRTLKGKIDSVASQNVFFCFNPCPVESGCILPLQTV